MQVEVTQERLTIRVIEDSIRFIAKMMGEVLLIIKEFFAIIEAYK